MNSKNKFDQMFLVGEYRVFLYKKERRLVAENIMTGNETPTDDVLICPHFGKIYFGIGKSAEIKNLHKSAEFNEYLAQIDKYLPEI